MNRDLIPVVLRKLSLPNVDLLGRLSIYPKDEMRSADGFGFDWIVKREPEKLHPTLRSVLGKPVRGILPTE